MVHHDLRIGRTSQELGWCSDIGCGRDGRARIEKSINFFRDYEDEKRAMMHGGPRWDQKMPRVRSHPH